MDSRKALLKAQREALDAPRTVTLDETARVAGKSQRGRPAEAPAGGGCGGGGGLEERPGTPEGVPAG